MKVQTVTKDWISIFPAAAAVTEASPVAMGSTHFPIPTCTIRTAVGPTLMAADNNNDLPTKDPPDKYRISSSRLSTGIGMSEEEGD